MEFEVRWLRPLIIIVGIMSLYTWNWSRRGQNSDITTSDLYFAVCIYTFFAVGLSCCAGRGTHLPNERAFSICKHKWPSARRRSIFVMISAQRVYKIYIYISLGLCCAGRNMISLFEDLCYKSKVDGDDWSHFCYVGMTPVKNKRYVQQVTSIFLFWIMERCW